MMPFDTGATFRKGRDKPNVQKGITASGLVGHDEVFCVQGPTRPTFGECIQSLPERPGPAPPLLRDA
jgi:hypothetical protein